MANDKKKTDWIKIAEVTVAVIGVLIGAGKSKE